MRACALFVDPSNIQQTADIIAQALCNADALKRSCFDRKTEDSEIVYSQNGPELRKGV